MSDRERTDAGTFAETVTLGGVLDVFDQVAGPVITSSDVADALDCTTEAARQKLTRLYDQGRVDKRKTGRTVVYWRTDDTDAESDREGVETTPGEKGDRSPATGPDAQAGGQTAPGDTALDDALAGWGPDTDADARTARGQTRRAAEWLASEGGHRRAGEFKDALAGESSLGERTWWERHVRPGLRRLADADLVEYTKNKGYRWVGDGDADPLDGEVYDPTEEF